MFPEKHYPKESLYAAGKFLNSAPDARDLPMPPKSWYEHSKNTDSVNNHCIMLQELKTRMDDYLSKKVNSYSTQVIECR